MQLLIYIYIYISYTTFLINGAIYHIEERKCFNLLKSCSLITSNVIVSFKQKKIIKYVVKNNCSFQANNSSWWKIKFHCFHLNLFNGNVYTDRMSSLHTYHIN